MEEASEAVETTYEAQPEDLEDEAETFAPAPAAQTMAYPSSPKKVLRVRRAVAAPKPKKSLLVARKARPGEAINRNTIQNGTSPGKRRGVRRTAYRRPGVHQSARRG